MLNHYYTNKKEIRQLYNRLKNSAEKRGIDFELTIQDIDDIGIPITCPVLGIPIHFNRGKPKDNSISFDRIYSSKGYIRDNVIIVSHRVNKLKSNATFEEIKKIVEYYNNFNNDT